MEESSEEDDIPAFVESSPDSVIGSERSIGGQEAQVTKPSSSSEDSDTESDEEPGVCLEEKVIPDKTNDLGHQSRPIYKPSETGNDKLYQPGERHAVTAVHCQYERKHRKNWQTANQQDLAQFTFDREQPIPIASPIHSPTHSPNVLSPVTTMPLTSRSTANSALKREIMPTKASRKAPARDDAPTVAPPVHNHPEILSVLANEMAELYFSNSNQEFSSYRILQSKLLLRNLAHGNTGCIFRARIRIGLAKKSLLISTPSSTSNVCPSFSVHTPRLVTHILGSLDLRIKKQKLVSRKD